MRRNVFFISILAFLFLLSGLSWGQDPVGPDSAYIDCTPPDVFVAPGPATVCFDLKLITDNLGSGKDITGMAQVLLITNSNAAANPVLDTTVATTYNGGAFPGPGGPGWDIRTTFVPTNGGDPSIFPLKYQLGQVEFSEAGLLAGTYTVARICLDVEDTTTICIDTSSTQTVTGFDITTSDVSSYDPRWAVGGYCCQVTPCTPAAAPVCDVLPPTQSGLSGSCIHIDAVATDADPLCCNTFVSATCDILEDPASEAGATCSPTLGSGFADVDFDWCTSATDEGTFHVVFTFTTDCDEVVACTAEVNLVAKCLFATIGSATGSPGSKVTVPITIDASGTSVGGFTFCIEYDPVMLTFVGLERGLFFDEPGPFAGSYKWHYLVWRNNPSTVIHKFKLCVVGIGKLYYYDGKCMAQGDSGVLNLTFRLSNNELYRCFISPIVWELLDPECIVNAFSDCSGNVVNVPDDTLYFNPNLCPGQFPKQDVVACVRLNNGGVIFRCEIDPLVRGDINVNGFPYEIGDAVLFANYFISGIGVFSADPETRERQINATDINADGLPLSVADLVYLLRILSGDQAPLGGAKLAPIASSVDAIYNGTKVSTKGEVDLGAAWFVFKGEATKVENLSGLVLQWGVSNGETRVLVYGKLGNKGDKISSGTSELFNISGVEELTKVEAAGYYGAPIDVNISTGVIRPTAFGLSQNYPNPFNASTTIKFALPVDGKVSLKIYNVAGQLVKEYQQQMNAGYRSITWDGTNASGKVVASGVYFYKLQAADFTKTLKMTLLK